MASTPLFQRYDGSAGTDEMFDVDGRARDSCAFLSDALTPLGEEEFRSRADSLARAYLDQGVTFDYAGEERPFPIDPIPRVISAEEWSMVSRGVSQRVRALEHLLDDVYTDQRAVADGVLPARLVESSTYVVDAMRGYRPPNGVRVHIAGIDLVRDGSGGFRVLEDNARTPSGVSYVLSNRRAMARTFPELFSQQSVRRVDAYPARLLQALRAAAPEDTEGEPTVVVLTPGRFNSAYFEHSLLARTMGVELVEGPDLVVSQDRVYMRTTAGLRRVDVIYKRTDDDFIDPEVFRPDSMLGVPGLVRAILAGNVVVANAIGNGVADDKLTYTYLPDLIRYYLAEEPVLANVDTWRLEDAEAREEVLDRLDELVVKPVDGSGGKGIVIGPSASKQELDALRERLLADPRGWIAQPVVQLSTIPTLVDEGPEPRHVDLRPFALNSGDDVWVLPGGLTRVALPKGEMVVNSSRGGGSKDTFVLAPADRRTAAGTARPESPAPSQSQNQSQGSSGTAASRPRGRQDDTATGRVDQDADGYEEDERYEGEAPPPVGDPDLPRPGDEPDSTTAAIPIIDEDELLDLEEGPRHAE
jgi:uncharacterized circularly permuted ATP-grasp superfamily protein